MPDTLSAHEFTRERKSYLTSAASAADYIEAAYMVGATAVLSRKAYSSVYDETERVDITAAADQFGVVEALVDAMRLERQKG